MDSKRVEDKLDKIALDISEINATLIEQASELKYHIRRTDLLEAQLKPVQDHVLELKGIVKALKALALLASIIEALHYFIR